MPSRVTVRRGYFPEADLVRFLASAHDELELLWWVLMSDAGMRVGEVRLLPFSQITDRSVRILGKGRKSRLVPLTSRILNIKEEAMRRYGFDMLHNICPFSGRTVQRRFDTCLKRAGLEKHKLCPHSLRHTFATRLLVAGVDIHRVGVLLGHASTQTTVGYLHTNEDSLRDARDRLEALNRGIPPPAIGETRVDGDGGPGDTPKVKAPSPRPYPEITNLVTPGAEAGGDSIPSDRRGLRSPIEDLSHLL